MQTTNRLGGFGRLCDLAKKSCSSPRQRAVAVPLVQFFMREEDVPCDLTTASASSLWQRPVEVPRECRLHRLGEGDRVQVVLSTLDAHAGDLFVPAWHVERGNCGGGPVTDEFFRGTPMAEAGEGVALGLLNPFHS